MSQLTKHSQKSLHIIENFLLYHFAPDANKDNTLYDQLMASAVQYVEIDHVDGEDAPEAIEEIEQRKKVEELLKAVEVVKNNPALSAEFRAQYATDFTEMETFIRANIFKKKAANLLLKLARYASEFYTIEYNGAEFPARTIVLSKNKTVEIATDALSDVMVAEMDRPDPNGDAERIDGEIYFYVDTDTFNLPHDKLVAYVKEHKD